MWHAKINKQSTDKTHVYIFIEKKGKKGKLLASRLQLCAMLSKEFFYAKNKK